MCLYSNVRETISHFRNNCDQKYGVPDTYHINNDNANATTFMKVISSLIQ